MSINNLKTPSIKLFVFGTLRKGGYLDYYMDGSEYAGLFYTQGQLMKSELGNAYIDFTLKGVATIGELYYANYPGLQRIDHLEGRSGEFPTGYDLDLIPIWELKEPGKFTFDEKDVSYAFFYRRKSAPSKIIGGDWNIRKEPVKEIGKYLKHETSKIISPEDLVNYMREYLG